MIIDGKKVAQELREQIKEKVSKLSIKPGLAVVLVGEDPASQIYVGSKVKKCEEVGINSYKYELLADTSEKDLLKLVDRLNKDNKVNGILVQMPLPSHISKEKIMEAVYPIKDIDGLHPMNIGKMVSGQNSLQPCTPRGIIKLLKYYNIKLSGKDVVVIGRSLLVGLPIAQMLTNENATVSVCHSKTKNLELKLSGADIIVAAVGIKNFVTRDSVKDGAVIIDVGINRDENKLFGDVNFDDVKDKCSFITPVPGGVGPMTIACLLENTLLAYNIQNKKVQESDKNEKLKIAVMASTNGTDLQAIIDAIKNNKLNAELKIVVANKECYAIERSKEQGIKNEIVLFDKEKDTRESYDRKVADILDKHEVELVVLVGYMRLFSPFFVKKYKNKIMNVHPSLLPSFPGMDRRVHSEVLEKGCKVTGCTIHFVDEGIDTGPIIIQEAVSVNNNDTIDSLKDKVQLLEKKLYPKVIQLYADGKIKVDGNKVVVQC